MSLCIRRRPITKMNQVVSSVSRQSMMVQVNARNVSENIASEDVSVCVHCASATSSLRHDK